MSSQFNPQKIAEKYCNLSTSQVVWKILFVSTFTLAAPILFTLYTKSLQAISALAACVWITIFMSIRIYICARNQNFEVLVLQARSMGEFTALLTGGRLGYFMVTLGSVFIVLALNFFHN